MGFLPRNFTPGWLLNAKRGFNAAIGIWYATSRFFAVGNAPSNRQSKCLQAGPLLPLRKIRRHGNLIVISLFRATVALLALFLSAYGRVAEIVFEQCCEQLGYVTMQSRFAGAAFLPAPFRRMAIHEARPTMPQNIAETRLVSTIAKLARW